MALNVYLPPSSIHYPQDSIRCTFRNGTSLAEFFKQILNGDVNIEDVTRIRCVSLVDGYWACSGNRRLYIYKKLEDLAIVYEIPVKILGKVPDHFWSLFTTKNNGKTVRCRGNPKLGEELEEIYLNFCKQGRLDNRNTNIWGFIQKTHNAKHIGRSLPQYQKASNNNRQKSRNNTVSGVPKTSPNGKQDWPALPTNGSRNSRRAASNMNETVRTAREATRNKNKTMEQSTIRSTSSTKVQKHRDTHKDKNKDTSTSKGVSQNQNYSLNYPGNFHNIAENFLNASEVSGETFYDGTAAVVDNEEQRYNIHDSLTIKQIKHFEDISQPYTSDRTDNRHSIWHTSTNQAPILENARYGFNVNANTRSRARLADADTRRGRDFTGTEDYNPDTFSEPAAGLGDADSGKSRLARRISQEQEKSTMCGCCTIL